MNVVNPPKRSVAYLAWILVATPVVFQLVYLILFSVNVPYWDQWPFVLNLYWYLNNGPWLQGIWHPHNEHRLFFPKLTFLLLAQITNWDVRAEMYFSFALVCSLLVVWMIIYRSIRTQSLWGFIPVSWLLYNLAQWENILWGWQIQVYLHLWAAILALLSLVGKSYWWTALAILFGVIASYSYGNGLLVWPVGLFLLLLLSAGRQKLLLWVVATFITSSIYFVNLSRHTSSSFVAEAMIDPVTTLTFLLAVIGAPLAGTYLSLAVALGVWLLFIAGVLLYSDLGAHLRRRENVSSVKAILYALLAFSLLSATLITLGRVGFGHMEWSLGSRYVTITSVGIVSTYLLLLHHARTAPPGHAFLWLILLRIFSGMLIIGLALGTWSGLKAGYLTYKSRVASQYALQTHNLQPDMALAKIYPVTEAIRQQTSFLTESELTAFEQPVNSVLLTVIEAGEPFGEILPESPVIQTILCPVATLFDLRILFGTYGRINHSLVRVTLLDQNQRVILARQIEAERIRDNHWHSFILDPPLEDCRGKELLLRIESVDGHTGNAVTVWTYPNYYEGSLLSPSLSNKGNRVTGIELNIQRYHPLLQLID
jgi:hypothetical protein